MNIIYRLNKIVGYSNEILDQNVIMVNSKEEFKEAMKLAYGEDIAFKKTKKLEDGDIYISIISYDCYNAEDYVGVNEYVCSNCGKHFKSNMYKLTKIYSTWEFKRTCEPLYHERSSELENYVYCCYDCREQHVAKLREEFEQYAKDNDIVSDYFVSRTDDYNDDNAGYIYMITKRSSKEFYIGQTNTIPMFRWVQHLKTERFWIDNIEDYIFEILEKVPDQQKLNDRESYWINLKYKENPNLCLNKIIYKNYKENNNGK